MHIYGLLLTACMMSNYDEYYFETLFPRVPVPIMRQIMANLVLLGTIVAMDLRILHADHLLSKLLFQFLSVSVHRPETLPQYGVHCLHLLMKKMAVMIHEGPLVGFAAKVVNCRTESMQVVTEEGTMIKIEMGSVILRGPETGVETDMGTKTETGSRREAGTERRITVEIETIMREDPDIQREKTAEEM